MKKIMQWPGDVKSRRQFDSRFNVTDNRIKFSECEIGANLIPKWTDWLFYSRRVEEFKNPNAIE